MNYKVESGPQMVTGSTFFRNCRNIVTQSVIFSRKKAFFGEFQKNLEKFELI